MAQVVSSLLHVVIPALWPCRRLSDLEATNNVTTSHVNWHQYTCPDGQVNELASLTLQNQEPV